MIKSICVLVFVLIQSLAMSQSITNYTTADGLPDNDVTCLVHDGNGTMWFGTQKGVAAFDGMNWESYTTESDSAIPQDAITAIAMGNNSDIWIGTDAGAAVYDGSEWKAFTTADGLGSNRVNHIATMSNGDIWFSEFNGATKYDGITFKAYSNSDGLPFGGVVKIAEDNNGDILMCTGLGGLVTFDGTNFTAYSTTEGLVSKNTTSIALDDKGNKWIGTVKGVTVLNSSNQWIANHTQMLEIPKPDTLNPVEDIAIDKFGTVWVGIYVDYLVTVGGVAYLDNGNWITIDASDGLVGPTIRQIALDGRGNLWVGTSSGISRIDNPNTASFKEVKDIPFGIYPNPARSNVTVSFDKVTDETMDILVLNNMAQVVKSGQVKMGVNSYSFNMLGQNPGLYFVVFNGLHKNLLVK